MTINKKTTKKKVLSSSSKTVVKHSTKKVIKSPVKYNHKRRIFESKQYKYQQKINKSMLRPGMIIYFDYKGKNVHDPNPLVLVLNKSWLGKLHGINLNYCNYTQIIKIGSAVNQKISARELKLGEKYKMTSPYGFYWTQLRPVLRMFKKSIYRTYFYSGVKDPKLMDYKFTAVQGKNVMIFNSKTGDIQTRISKAKIQNIKRHMKRRKQDIVKQVNLNTKQTTPLALTKKETELINNRISGDNIVRNVPSKNVKMVKTPVIPNVKKN